MYSDKEAVVVVVVVDDVVYSEEDFQQLLLMFISCTVKNKLSTLCALIRKLSLLLL